jgi:predicted RecA/RadA family phage recombinase
MKNFIQRGDVIAIPAPADVSSGDGVLVGSLFGVAITDAASGQSVECAVEGAVFLAKATGVWTTGAPIYWDESAGVATTDDDTGSNLRIGVAIAAALEADATGPVKLLGQAI